MKRLIIVRHGDYENYVGNLTGVGRKRIEILARRLAPFVFGKVAMLSSTAIRALETAEVLAVTLGGRGIKTYDALLSSPGKCNLKGALYAVKQAEKEVGAETFILSTHYEHAQFLPQYFGEKELGVTFEAREIERGEAWVIDCETKTLILIQNQ